MTNVVKIANQSTELSWSSEQRVVRVNYTADAVLTHTDGDFLIDALTGWIGESPAPFAVFSDAAGLHGVDAEYRAKVGGFFRAHRDSVFLGLINLGPVIRVVVELFRIGTNIQLRTFANEDAARSWFRTKGVAA